MFAQSPDVFRHAVRGFSLYRNVTLDPRLRELGQARAGYARGSQFVFSQHCKQMRTLGAPEDKIAAPPHWQVSDCFSALERAVLAYTDGLVYDGGRVPDEVFAVLKAHLTDPEILQLTYITTLYDMHATMCRALRLEFDDRPELIAEVEIPPESRSATFRSICPENDTSLRYRSPLLTWVALPRTARRPCTRRTSRASSGLPRRCALRAGRGRPPRAGARLRGRVRSRTT